MRSGVSGVHATPPIKSPIRIAGSPQLPLGTAVQDASVERRTIRAVSELLDSFPELEGHESAISELLLRALKEQDRASRMHEVFGRTAARMRRSSEHSEDVGEWQEL